MTDNPKMPRALTIYRGNGVYYVWHGCSAYDYEYPSEEYVLKSQADALAEVVRKLLQLNTYWWMEADGLEDQARAALSAYEGAENDA